MCGEHRSGFNALFFLTGSSPHVRGARKDSPLRRCHSGIIPACAGSTLTLAVSRSRARDHPRMCGEHRELDVFPRTRVGSSPHVRGALRLRTTHVIQVGIIPRMCGEHSVSELPMLFRSGSSPHVRGALGMLPPESPLAGIIPHVRGARSAAASRIASMGIIPACAGSTKTATTTTTVTEDHPRMCGEHTAQVGIVKKLWGSSPHVRGALDSAGDFLSCVGIIPACAGSTPQRHGCFQRWRDHPRMCGEHLCFDFIHHAQADHPRMCGEHFYRTEQIPFFLGSSPHVRGARFGGIAVLRLHGIIPRMCGEHVVVHRIQSFSRDHPRMCGEHRITRSLVMARGDHPRMCGEHYWKRGFSDCRVGSSPHVRGARTRIRFDAHLLGIIPACAGSTLRK